MVVIPGFEQGVQEVLISRESAVSWTCRFSLTRQWARQHRGNVSAYIAASGETPEAAIEAAVAAFEAASEETQLPLL